MILMNYAPYTPFDHPRTVGPPGLNPMDMADWVVVHDDYAAQMAYRAKLLEDHREIVLACNPEAQAAAGELYDMVLHHLAHRPDFQCRSDHATRPDGVTVSLDPDRPLETLNCLTAEDWCLLLPDDASGEYRLVGAILCFPSRWLLTEKLNRPLTMIHEPVPEYGDSLARRVNRMFETLRPERALVRCNWLVHGDPELYRPIGREQPEVDRTEVADQGIFLRTERQSLVRLPETGAVVFGIKTSVTRLESLTPPQAGALKVALGDLTQEMLDYSERGEAFRAAMTTLEAVASG